MSRWIAWRGSSGDGGDPGAVAASSFWRGPGGAEDRLADERDDDLQGLRANVGEITTNNELLLERCHRLGANLPFTAPEAERVSQTCSPSTERRYGLARVCRMWEVARSTVYLTQGAASWQRRRAA